MLFDLTFPCYLTSFSGKKCLSGKLICAFLCPAYRSSPVHLYRSSAQVLNDRGTEGALSFSPVLPGFEIEYVRSPIQGKTCGTCTY
jgi:hypothetical protein